MNIDVVRNYFDTHRSEFTWVPNLGKVNTIFIEYRSVPENAFPSQDYKKLLMWLKSNKTEDKLFSFFMLKAIKKLPFEDLQLWITESKNFNYCEELIQFILFSLDRIFGYPNVERALQSNLEKTDLELEKYLASILLFHHPYKDIIELNNDSFKVSSIAYYETDEYCFQHKHRLVAKIDQPYIDALQEVIYSRYFLAMTEYKNSEAQPLKYNLKLLFPREEHCPQHLVNLLNSIQHNQ